MNKKWISAVLALLIATSTFVGCNKNNKTSQSTPNEPTSESEITSESSSSNPNGGEITVDTGVNFDFNEAFSSTDKWVGVLPQNPVFDTTNKFVTFRKKSNNIITYTGKGMSTGDIELKMKVKVTKDTTAYVGFSNRSDDLTNFCYDKGSYAYTLEFANDSKMYVKKWIDGAENVLSGSKSSASVPVSLASKLTNVKISVKEEGNSVNIIVYCDNKETLNVTDSDNPYLGGGAISLSYMGEGGMVVGSKASEDGKYTAPEELGLTIYDQPSVDVWENGTLDLLADFNNTWVGRERIFNVSNDGTGYVFETKDNPEEPQAGVTEYQAVYKDKIFKNVEMEYKFNQISNGEWTMFWFRCVPETDTDVSIWGNKKTGQNTNGYSMLVTVDGFVQVHKWTDGAQIWLNGQGTKLPGQIASLFNDPNAEITVKMSIEEKPPIGGKPTIEFKISVNGCPPITVQDNDTPFLNAGYIGMQGFATNNKIDSIRLLSAKVTALNLEE